MDALRRFVLLLCLAVPLQAEGKPNPPNSKVESLGDGVEIIWLKEDLSYIQAPGSAAADLRTPSAEIARIKAERQAKERAAARLKSALLRLPKGRFAGPAPKAEQLAAVFEGDTAKVEVHDVFYSTNGSVSLRLRCKLTSLPSSPVPPSQAGKKP